MNLMVGSTFKRVNIEQIRNFYVPMPSPSEQRAIAAALSDVDALLSGLEQLIAKKRAIKQATMQQLLNGKTRLPGFCGEWELRQLGDVTVKVGNGITPSGGEKVYREEGRPFIRSQNIGWGRLLLDDVAYIDEETHSSFPATEVMRNDVLLNITGASIGRSAIADDRVKGGNVNQHVCIIRADATTLDARFLNLLLLSEAGQKQIDSYQAGGNRQGLNFGQIKSMQIHLPDFAEQTAIAAVLSDMDAEIAALEQRRDKTRLLKQGMVQELLTGRIRLI